MAVFTFPRQDVIVLGEQELQKLKKAVHESPLRRARYCLHHSWNDQVQEMVIVLHRESVIPVHRHVGKSESFHLIDGEMEVIFFDDDARRTGSIKLGGAGSELPFLYRLSGDCWHTVRPLSEYVVYHETIAGPFIAAEIETLEVPSP